MIKRLVCALMCAGIVLCLCSCGAAKDEFSYELSSGDAAITGYTGDSLEIDIPSKIDGYTVTAIADNAFEKNRVVSVTLPESVVRIGENAFFGCGSLASFTATSSLKTVGAGAFYCCTSLAEIIGFDGVTLVGEKAFDNTEWLNTNKDGVVYVGNTVYDYIGEIAEGSFLSFKLGVKSFTAKAMMGCGLEGIAIPSTVTSIGDRAFQNCSKLQNVIIHSAVSKIGELAFNNCTAMTLIKVEVGNNRYAGDDGILTNADKTLMICCPAGKPGDSYSIPSRTVEISEYCFDGCGFKSITLPGTLTAVQSNAFLDCKNLLSIEIPETVMQIGEKAFGYLESGKKISGFKIICAAGSAAHSYAQENGFEFELK